MAEDEDGYFSIHWLQLLEGSKDENGGLSVARLGLAEYVHTKNRLGNAFLLDWKQGNVRTGKDITTFGSIPSEGCSKPRSLMARRSSGFKRKSLEGRETVETETCAHGLPETSGVDTREVLFLLVAIVAHACGSSRSTGTIRDDIVLVLVVNKLLVIVGHVGLKSKKK